ncbi:hypothetical protein [Ramlibacter sp. WS9]|uniref:pilus assembly PilX family protein n=1 Tax=Ramlibacter sp. WS9 TaxID=1882741 RepID=UPI001143A859|nr:hypothetical protein [Ramlibacter sp. WS9]ROZ75817.1 hypothetical protein EEB15_14780 [Ramlibacter sp. WS9]
MSRRAQSGITLVVSLIMLIVLTLLVVSAIRFGNINLKITGNAQTQAESGAAAQVAIEKVIASAVAGSSLSAMITTTASVSTGGMSYSVTVAKPICKLTQNVDTSTLDPSNENDLLCYGQQDKDGQETATGTITQGPSACKDQRWDISASIGDSSTGAKTTVLQGAGLRVSAEVACPTS